MLSLLRGVYWALSFVVQLWCSGILLRFAAEPVEVQLARHPFGVEEPCSVSNPLGIGWATSRGRRLCCAIFEEARGRINLILFRCRGCGVDFWGVRVRVFASSSNSIVAMMTASCSAALSGTCSLSGGLHGRNRSSSVMTLRVILGVRCASNRYSRRRRRRLQSSSSRRGPCNNWPPSL